MDANGNMFTKTTVDLRVDGRQMIVVLEAEQAELLMKLLRVVPYAD